MKIEFGTINSEDKKKESLQSVKVRGQSLIAVVVNPPSRDNVRQ